MKNKKNTRNEQGAALLTVLIIVMAITILSLGYVARSDTELVCGNNTLLRIQMDYLSESSLEHAKELILNPQNVDTGGSPYWTGAEEQQLTAGEDYYDVSVVELGPCNYQITGGAYRQKGGETVGRSGLTAELRLDPCIAYWAGTTTIIPAMVTINGDVYCAGNLTNNGTVDGDAFAGGMIIGEYAGSRNELLAAAPVGWPSINVSDFSSQYYIGYTGYTVQSIDPNISNISLGPNGANPAGIFYCNGDMVLSGNVTINGTLAVNGNLTIIAAGNIITAVKNFPAVLVGGEMLITDGGELEINGLAKVKQQVRIDPSATNFVLDVYSALFVENGGIVGGGGSGQINITAFPRKAAFQFWPSPGNAVNWKQAGGAFFKTMERN